MLVFSLLNILIIVFILLGVAFYTLFERKVLSLCQIRVGPNKFFVVGFLQPVIDGLKLMLKEFFIINMSKKMNLFIFPAFMFLIMMFLWSVLMSKYTNPVMKFNFLLFLGFLGVSIFFIMFSALLSKSKFAFFGSFRSAGQSVSYEICLAFLVFSPMLCLKSLTLNSIESFFYLILLIFPFWWVCCVIECNRAPFDFSEGESELISGFNVEYSSLGFIFIFLSEYGMMLFFSYFTSLIFLNIWFFFILFGSMIVFRAAYPRFRYDLLMKMCWFVFLPSSICFLFFYLMI